MITRRSLLKLGGAGAAGALFTPLLSHIASAQARPLPRFVFFIEGNGFEPVTVLSPSTRIAIDGTLATPIGAARYWSRQYRHTHVLETSGDLAMAPSLAALAATPTLASKTAVLLGLSSKITGGGHSARHGVLSSTRTAATGPSGETIDAHLSRLPMLSGRAFDALRLGYASMQFAPSKLLDFGTCALGPGVSAPLVIEPRSAIDSCFGAISTDPAVRAQFDRNGRVLDFAQRDVTRSIAAFTGDPTQRARLEAYLAAIQTTVTSRQRLSTALMMHPPPVPAYPAARTPENIFVTLTAHASLISAALQGGLTQVAVLGIGTGGDFDTFYGPEHTARHPTYHASITDSTARDYVHHQSQRQIEVMFALAQALDAVPEGTGTLLDQTVLVYIGDNGETHHATADEFPVIVMGGGALGLRTGGRTLVYPGIEQFHAGHRQVSNLWNTLGHLAGENLNTFGGESLLRGSRAAEGPLTELM